MKPKPFLIVQGNRPGLTIQYFATRNEALAFAEANPARVSILLFGTMSGTKGGRPYVALNVFTPAALRQERAEIAKADRERAARNAERDCKIATGAFVLPTEIIPTELGL
jgi:hypothetical protein